MQYFWPFKKHQFYAVECQIRPQKGPKMTSEGRKGEPHSCHSKSKKNMCFPPLGETFFGTNLLKMNPFLIKFGTFAAVF